MCSNPCLTIMGFSECPRSHWRKSIKDVIRELNKRSGLTLFVEDVNWTKEQIIDRLQAEITRLLEEIREIPILREENRRLQVLFIS